MGALLIKDSSLNLVKTLIEHQNKLSPELKVDLNQTMSVRFSEAVRHLQDFLDSNLLTYLSYENTPAASDNAMRNTDTAIL